MGNSVLDTCSSGEELTIKTRKPYTITKQRERWTEEEHNRFLEAVKKHGRAWQRIEEHIGTKTAVQIRSHAQKFFSKLEREALNKGMSATKAHDIDVPPPRPKRKPSNPYPRKTAMVASISPEVDSKNSSVSSTQCSNLVMSLENGLTSQERSTQRKEKEISSEGGDSPQVLTLFEEAPCASISSASKAPPNPGAFREFMPTKKETSDQTQMDEVSAIAKSKEKLKLERPDVDCTDLEIGIPQGSKLDNRFLNPHTEAPPLEIKNDLNPFLASKEMQVESTHGYPRHVFVLVLDGDDMETSTPIPSLDLADSSPMVPQLGSHGSPSRFKNQTISATELHNNSAGSAACPPFSIFHPHVTHFHGNADTQKLSNPACALNVSSALSSLIISNLLQNPAAHAAASLAASYWPCTDIGNSIDRGLFRYMNSSPSIAAVAAATVAAATAWWATHGLLPVCPPHPTSFAFAPTPPTTIPITEAFPFPLSENTEERKQGQPLHPELSATPEARHEVSASSRLSSSGSEESSETDPDGTKLETGDARREKISTGVSSDQAKPIKQVDRSSCGSNTPSSSEIEADVLLENQEEEGKEESKAAELGHPDSELSNRRCRSAGNINDSWKEVSEEGRMAFRALFSRQVLPQSFSSPQDLRNKLQPNSSMEQENQNLMKKDEDTLTLRLDLNDTTSHLLRSNADKGFAVAGLGHGKSKDRPTGFEPYKRCSAQTSPESDEKGAKRIRLQGKAAI